MIPEIGHLALVLALVVALVQGTLPLVGAQRRIPGWVAVAAPAALAQLALVAVAFLALTYAYLVSDFSVVNVAENSHTAKPLLYKVTGVWGNHEGSLLLWVLILTLFGAAVAAFGGNLPPTLRARVLAIQALIGVGFLLFVLFTSNPFARLAPAPLEGRGLNPLLQDPGLAFHPPFLYLGYVGFSIAVLLRGRGADRRPRRCDLGALGAALDAARLELPDHRDRRWAATGPITSSAGAAGGSGIRWRTRRSCHGWPAPRCCTPRSSSRSATR